MTDIINTDASPGDTFYDMSEVREAMGDPRYRTSARYRDEVAAKLHRSQQAGTVVSQTSYHGSQKRTLGRDRDYDFGHPNANANANGFIQPGADQAWAEAAKVGQAGSIFKSPEEIMWAMAKTQAAAPWRPPHGLGTPEALRAIEGPPGYGYQSPTPS
jgi:hypothetical protein